MKICLMGSHGVGKTTSLKTYEKEGFNIFPEVTRELMELKVVSKIPSLEERLFLTKIKERQFNNFLQLKGNAVIDRSAMDLEVYRTWLEYYTLGGKYENSVNFFKKNMNDAINMYGTKEGVEYIYLKVETEDFQPKQDKYRPEDKKFFWEIQGIFDLLCNQMKTDGFDVQIVRSPVDI